MAVQLAIPELTELVAMVEDDAVAIATQVLATVKPPEIILKIETMGANRCRRWHRDWYTGRVICTYNGVATEFQDDANVDFDKMAHPDLAVNATCPVDPAKTLRCRAGDFLYMRGMQRRLDKDHAGRREGLVHRSPTPGSTLLRTRFHSLSHKFDRFLALD